MNLSKQKFKQLIRKKQLLISLIGMSNIGKTYWAKKLSATGFNSINCDDLMDLKFASIFKKIGYSGLKGISIWMGSPYNKKFSSNQKKYLSLEEEVMEDVFKQINNIRNKNIVIDTTGSIVHTDKNVCKKLKKCSLVIYIKATKNIKEDMFKQYIKEPRPLIFGDTFVHKKNETDIQTLKRCYFELLNLRNKLYTKCADVIISREAINKNLSAHQFISLILKLL